MSKAESIARRLKQARIDANMAVKEAAHEAGFTEPGLRAVEDGIVKRPSFLQVMRLIRIQPAPFRECASEHTLPIMDS